MRTTSGRQAGDVGRQKVLNFVTRFKGGVGRIMDLAPFALPCAGTLEDLARHQFELTEGMLLTFYMDDEDDQGRRDDLQIDGTVEYNHDERCWVAAVDWAALRDASAETEANGAVTREIEPRQSA
jgi:hypothetical protein